MSRQKISGGPGRAPVVGFTGGQGTHPPAGVRSFWIDLGEIDSVDEFTKTLTVATEVGKMPTAGVEWVSPLFDPKTGHGIQTLPKKGMRGIVLCVGSRKFFLAYTGVPSGDTLDTFTNSREPLVPGGVVIRTSPETKFIWSPNILIAQAANLCKVVLQRVSKAIELTFFKFRANCVGGTLSWETDLKSRFNRILFQFRSRLRAGRDPRGNTPPDDALHFTLELGGPDAAGAKTPLPPKKTQQVQGLSVEDLVPKKKKEDRPSPIPMAHAFIAPPKPEELTKQPSTRALVALDVRGETVEVQALRAFLTLLFQQHKIDTFKALKALEETPLHSLAEFAKFTGETDLTQDALINSIVSAASYSNPITGERRLLFDAGTLVDTTSPIGVSEEAPAPKPEEPHKTFFQANPLAKTLVNSPNTGRRLLKEAREASTLQDIARALRVFDLTLGLFGGIQLTHSQMCEIATERMLEWQIKEGFGRLKAHGFNLEATKNGTVMLTNGNAGIAFAPDGAMTFYATKFKFVPWLKEEEPKVEPPPGAVPPGTKVEEAPPVEDPNPRYRNNGTLVTVSTDGITLASKAKILLQSESDIRLETRDPATPGQVVITESMTEEKKITRKEIQKDLRSTGGVRGIGGNPEDDLEDKDIFNRVR